MNPGIHEKGELLVARAALTDDVPWETISPQALYGGNSKVLDDILGKARYLGTLPIPRITDHSSWRHVITSNCATSDHSDDKRQIPRMSRAGLSQVVNGFQGCSRIRADEGSQCQVANPELIWQGYQFPLFFKSLNRTQTSLGPC